MRLTSSQARRIQLAAQGFGRPTPSQVSVRQLGRVLGQTGQFQIDSVNVAVRAHYMPAFARLGGYDRSLLDRMAGVAPRRGFEFWGHAAALIDVELYAALEFRRVDHASRPWQKVRELLADQPGLVEKVYEQVAQDGPLTARQVQHDEPRTAGGWWNWSQVKYILEWLFYIGRLTSAGRNAQFERCYDLPERVLPRAVLDSEPLGELDGSVQLLRRTAAALGVATQAALAEYFYTAKPQTRAAIDVLLATGELEEVEVRGWSAPGFLWSAAARPRSVHTDALIAPFDSLAFDRKRLLETFGVHYRIGLYTPKAQRVEGYYVYLFLADEEIVARVDLKADRAASTLLIQSAWLEDGAVADRVVGRLAAKLLEFATWLGLSDIVVKPIGSLAADLAAQF